MGLAEEKREITTHRGVRTVVRAAATASLPPEFTRWAAEHSVRVLSRRRVSEAIAAARDTNASLLIVECVLAEGDPEVVLRELDQRRPPSLVLCVGDEAEQSTYLTRGVRAFVDARLGWPLVLRRASRLLDEALSPNVQQSGVRRTQKSVIQVGPMVIELTNRRVFVNDEALRLRPAEFEVLALLALNRQRPVSAPEIVQHALATHGDGSSARNQLFELRRKLRDAGLLDVIVTIRNQGYQLVLR